MRRPFLDGADVGARRKLVLTISGAMAAFSTTGLRKRRR
jgi:hypothetical protein